MSKWTRANPLAAVSGYSVPQGHFANGYTNGGDRVGFKKDLNKSTEGIDKVLTSTNKLVQKVEGKPITKSGISKGKDIK